MTGPGAMSAGSRNTPESGSVSSGVWPSENWAGSFSPPVHQSEHEQPRVGDACGAERVARIGLGGRHCGAPAEDAVHGGKLGGVVLPRARAVKIHVDDVVGREARTRERAAHGRLGAPALGFGARHVVAVGTLAPARKLHGRGTAGEKHQACALADRDAGTMVRQGTRALAREHAQGVKAVQGHVGEGVGSARNDGVGQPRLKKAGCADDGAGRARAGRRDRVGGALGTYK